MFVRHLALAGLVLLGLTLPGAAQDLRPPRELPPEGFAGDQYVDSGGCVFLRAGVGGRVTWVPRVSRERRQLCGQKPSFAPEPVVAEAAAPPAAKPQAAAPKPPPAPRAAAKPARKAGTATAAAPLCPPTAATPGKLELRDRRTIVLCTPSQQELDALARVAVPALTIEGGKVRKDAAGRRLFACTTRAPVPRPFAVPGGGTAVLCLPSDGSAPGATRTYRQDPTDGRLVAVGGSGAGAGGAATGAARVAPPAATPAATRVARPATPPAATVRYVQVGSYASAANARQAGAVLRRMGLPVEAVRATLNGQAVRVVLAGPFVGADAAVDALVAARRAGFRDAFLR